MGGSDVEFGVLGMSGEAQKLVDLVWLHATGCEEREEVG